MLPPLSPLTYYRRNLLRTLPVGGAIVISVFLVASIVTLLHSVDDSITVNYGFVRRFSVLTTQVEADVAPAVLARVRRLPQVARIIPAVPYFKMLHTVFGEMPVPVYGVDQAMLPELARLTGNHLSEGRWPHPNAPEIALSRVWVNNLGRRLGDTLEVKNDRVPMLRERQRIVGILDGGDHLALADRSYLLLEMPAPILRTSYLVVPRSAAQHKALNRSIDDLLQHPARHGLSDVQTVYVKFYTFDNLVQELRKGLRFLYKFLALADTLVIGAVALLSGFLANIYFEQRLGEFGLLAAFGFRREQQARRLIVETGALVVLGWGLGLSLTWLLFRALDVFYTGPRGLILARLDGSAILYTLPTPLIVALASLATVLIRLYRLDPIDIMERR